MSFDCDRCSRSFETRSALDSHSQAQHDSPGIAETELLEDIRRVAEDIDGRPTQTQYMLHGNYSPATIQRRFGSWSGGVDRALEFVISPAR